MPLRLVKLVLGLLAFLALGGCQGDKKPAGLDRAKLCESGNAKLSAANECVCEADAKWNGVRCEVFAVPATAEKTSPPADSAPSADAAPSAPSAVKTADTESPNATPKSPTHSQQAAAAAATAARTRLPPPPDRSRSVSLEATCKRADAMWVAEDQTCHCPDAKVLVGLSCRTLRGAVSDDACRRAVHPGRWNAGHCECSAGKRFSPARGGCVAPQTTVPLSLRRICESSLNRGKWEVRGNRCLCPSGRVWNDETCNVQEQLTSRDVCESGFNQGNWDSARKRCDCPAGRTWIDQSCRASNAMSAKAACESEGNGGRWQAGTVTCACPRGSWSASGKRCR